MTKVTNALSVTDKIMWEWLIETRSDAINAEWSFYGGCYDADPPVREITTHDVEWSAMRPLSDCRETAFDGTFNDATLLSTLQGDLYLLNGEEYRVGLRIETSDVLNEVVEYMHNKLQAGS